jgi:hypothetical protein
VDLPIVFSRAPRAAVGGQAAGTTPPNEGARDQPRPDPRVARAEQRLMRQLSRAATQGTVKMQMQVAPDDVGGSTAAPRLSPHPPAGAATASSNLDATTPVDASTSPAGNSEDAFSKVDCIDAASLDIGLWGWPEGVAVGIAHWRKRLFKEFDTQDSQAALRLARLYLHYGFGAEARVILMDADIASAQRRVPLAMSYIVDIQNEKTTDVFTNQSNCDGPAALWGVLSLTPRIRRGPRTRLP